MNDRVTNDEGWLLEGACKDSQSVTRDWQFQGRRLIVGVRIREVGHVPTSYGFLTEIFRRDWELDDGPVDQVFQASLSPGAVSAWHAHEHTVDRLFVSRGLLKVVLYDARPGSETFGQVDELTIGTVRPALVVIPPKVWHGVQNASTETGTIVNAVDRAYRYEDPDHWRVPADSPAIPYRFR